MLPSSPTTQPDLSAAELFKQAQVLGDRDQATRDLARNFFSNLQYPPGTRDVIGSLSENFHRKGAEGQTSLDRGNGLSDRAISTDLGLFFHQRLPNQANRNEASSKGSSDAVSKDILQPASTGPLNGSSDISSPPDIFFSPQLPGRPEGFARIPFSDLLPHLPHHAFVAPTGAAAATHLPFPTYPISPFGYPPALNLFYPQPPTSLAINVSTHLPDGLCHSPTSIEEAPSAQQSNRRIVQRRTKAQASHPYRLPQDERPSTVSSLDYGVLPELTASAAHTERPSAIFWLDNKNWRFIQGRALAQCIRCENMLVLGTPLAIGLHEKNCHNTPGPFLCGLEGCTSGFPALRSRISHIARTHPAENKCSFCDEGLQTKNNINFDSAYETHLFSDHLRVIRWQCSKCTSFKDSLAYLSDHYKRVHKTTPEETRESFINKGTGLPLNAHYINVDGSTIITAYSQDQQPKKPNLVTWTLDLS